MRERAIARYLWLVPPSGAPVKLISVHRDDVSVRLSRPVWLPITIPLSRALRDFILLFDASIPPDLEDQRDCERESEAESGATTLA